MKATLEAHMSWIGHVELDLDTPEKLSAKPLKKGKQPKSEPKASSSSLDPADILVPGGLTGGVSNNDQDDKIFTYSPSYIAWEKKWER